MKPREFWLNEDPLYQRSPIVTDTKEEMDLMYLPDPSIHVREVVPIDWPKIWEQMRGMKVSDNWSAVETKLQDLVERAIKGELE